IADEIMLQQRASALGLQLHIERRQGHVHQGEGSLQVLHLSTSQSVVAGQLNCANSQYVLSTLTTALEGCLQQRFDAMVTAPVHKGIINQAKIPFTGHTEFLAEHSKTEQVVMMLVGG